MESIVVVDAALSEERRVWEEKQARRRQEHNDKVAAYNAKLREIEMERARKEAEENENMSNPTPLSGN